MENPTYTYWPLQRCQLLQWFYSLSRRNTFVRDTCAPPSAILVWNWNMFVLLVIDSTFLSLFLCKIWPCAMFKRHHRLNICSCSQVSKLSSNVDHCKAQSGNIKLGSHRSLHFFPVFQCLESPWKTIWPWKITLRSSNILPICRAFITSLSTWYSVH